MPHIWYQNLKSFYLNDSKHQLAAMSNNNNKKAFSILEISLNFDYDLRITTAEHFYYMPNRVANKGAQDIWYSSPQGTGPSPSTQQLNS